MPHSRPNEPYASILDQKNEPNASILDQKDEPNARAISERRTQSGMAKRSQTSARPPSQTNPNVADKTKPTPANGLPAPARGSMAAFGRRSMNDAEPTKRPRRGAAGPGGPGASVVRLGHDERHRVRAWFEVRGPARGSPAGVGSVPRLVLHLRAASRWIIRLFDGGTGDPRDSHRRLLSSPVNFTFLSPLFVTLVD